MNRDKSWLWIVFAGLVALVMIIHGHFSRVYPPNKEVKTQTADGSTVIVNFQNGKTPKTLDFLPSRAADKDREKSKEAWRSGNYKIVPSSPELLIVENGFERKVFFQSDFRTYGCSFDAHKVCFGDNHFETPVSKELPRDFYNPEFQRPPVFGPPGRTGPPPGDNQRTAGMDEPDDVQASTRSAKEKSRQEKNQGKTSGKVPGKTKVK